MPLSEVAKRAGVGAGTLYRHFPTREDLILAAYEHDIERLTTTADEVLARHSSAKAAFVEWFETLAAYIRIKHGLGDALHSAEGTIAAGHDPADIIMLMSFLWRVANNDEGAAQARRLIAAVFFGLQQAPRPV